MTQATAPAVKTYKRLGDRQAAMKAFEDRAAAAGHAPGARTGPDGDGYTWTQYACACGGYLSVRGTRAYARQGWASHARAVLVNLRRGAVAS